MVGPDISAAAQKTKLGVPIEGWLVNGCLTSWAAVLVVRSPLGFMLLVPIHFALRELHRHDPHFFRRWKLRMQKQHPGTGCLSNTTTTQIEGK